MIKLKFALFLSINSKNQTQKSKATPKWMSFALMWELGEEVPFEPNLLGFKHKKIGRAHV